MRVISGTQKGRALKSVPGKNTRPTTDKVKESIFNMIGPYFNEGIGLDMFAGSGALGIEGISRGLEKVIFIDHNGKAIQTIKENVKICGFEKKAEIYKNDWKKALQKLVERSIQLEVIWLDPPYKELVYQSILEIISQFQLLSNSGVIVCEHTEEIELPNKVHMLEKVKTVTYGTIGISLYKLINQKEDLGWNE